MPNFNSFLKPYKQMLTIIWFAPSVVIILFLAHIDRELLTMRATLKHVLIFFFFHQNEYTEQ